jgi:hypothetical protein
MNTVCSNEPGCSGSGRSRALARGDVRKTHIATRQARARARGGLFRACYTKPSKEKVKSIKVKAFYKVKIVKERGILGNPHAITCGVIKNRVVLF